MSIFRNFGYNLLLTLGNVLFPLLTFPFLSRIIGPEGIGRVQFVVTFTQYFIMVAALGIPIYGVREIAKSRHNKITLKKTASELLGLNIFTSVILTFVYYFVIYRVSFFKEDLAYYIISSLMLVTSFLNVEWLFSGLERFKFIAIRSLAIKAASFCFILLFINSEGDDKIYLWILVLSNLVNGIWNIWEARGLISVRLLVKKKMMKHWRPLFYVFSTIAAISIYAMLDTVFLGFMQGYEAVGYYTASFRVTKPIIPILTAFGTVLIPKISKSFQLNDIKLIQSYISDSLRFVVVLGIPMCLGIIILSNDLLVVLCGDSFTSSRFSTQIFAIIVFIIGLSNVWAMQILTPGGKDKFVMYSVMAGLVVSIILNVTLIPLYSFNGAAIANFVTELCVMLLFFIFSKRLIPFRIDVGVFISSFLSSLPFYPIWLLAVFLFSGHHLLICVFTVLSSIIVYLFSHVYLFRNKYILFIGGDFFKKREKNE